MRKLSDTDQRALRLASHVQKAVEQRLSGRGVPEQ
jgi:hypothetical protein